MAAEALLRGKETHNEHVFNASLREIVHVQKLPISKNTPRLQPPRLAYHKRHTKTTFRCHAVM